MENILKDANYDISNIKCEKEKQKCSVYMQLKLLSA
jgi:hypothetical protein